MFNPKSLIMKNSIKTFLLIPFFALLLFTSCQEEEVSITSPEDSEALTANSELTSLMFSTSIMDGSADNIIDNASCLSVELPVTVVVNGLEIIIDSEEDFNVIETIFKEFEDDEDDLEIIFPITIILSDHEEIVIENREALEALIAECKGDNEEDDDIECIDFQYPISFSIFDTDFQIINVVTIESDRELYRFLKRVKNAEVIASLNFPITLEYADGNTIEVNNNEELATTIKEAKDLCDEDDDNDYGDDDFTKERLDEYLKICPWVVYEFKRYNQDNTSEYKEYALNFKEDGVVVMRARGGNVLTGTWSTRVTNMGALLKLEFENPVDFNLEWIVYDIEYGKIKLYQTSENIIIMKKNCDVVIDITKERIKNFLKECLWRVDSLSVQGVRKDSVYIGTPLKFYDDDIVKLRVKGELVEGTYDVGTQGSNFTLKMTLDGRSDLKLEWGIYFLEEDLIKLSNDNSKMILSRHCPDTDGDLKEIDAILLENDWRVTWYQDEGVDKTEQFKDWAFGFDESGKAFAEGDGRNVYGSWLSYRSDGLFLGLKYDDDALIDTLNFRWKIVEISETRIQLKEYDTYGAIVRILVFEKW